MIYRDSKSGLLKILYLWLGLEPKFLTFNNHIYRHGYSTGTITLIRSEFNIGLIHDRITRIFIDNQDTSRLTFSFGSNFSYYHELFFNSSPNRFCTESKSGLLEFCKLRTMRNTL